MRLIEAAERLFIRKGFDEHPSRRSRIRLVIREALSTPGAVQELGAGKPAIVQIERNGLFIYIEWEPQHLPKAVPGRGRQ